MQLQNVGTPTACRVYVHRTAAQRKRQNCCKTDGDNDDGDDGGSGGDGGGDYDAQLFCRCMKIVAK